MRNSLIGHLIWSGQEEDGVEVEGASWSSFSMVSLDVA